MAETLTVALRVAEEAIDEAISKAEFENTSQVVCFFHTFPGSSYFFTFICHQVVAD